MPSRAITRRSTVAGFAAANVAPIYVDSDDNLLKIIPAGTGSTEQIVAQLGGIAPVDASAATLTVTADAHAGRTINLNRAAGVTATLPAATGTGNVYTFVVQATVTSNNDIIKVANGTDFMVGTAFFDGDDAANAANGFTTANTGTVATESDTITMNGTTTGGIKGALVTVRDIATAIFQVQMFSAASGTEATPFSATV